MHVAAPAPAASKRRPRRALGWLLVLLAVLLLHGWLLGVLTPQPPRAAAGQPRSTALLLLPVPLPVPPAAPELALPAPPPAEAPAPAQAAPPAEPPAPTARADAAETSDVLPAVRAASVPAVYATRMPASTSLHYRLQRGEQVGSAELHWQRGDDGYELTLEGALQGMPVLGSASRGQLDADGIAPLRYADRRRARELRAANFQRDAGLITFSGPRTEYALRAGAQDRLSWMIQLPAIVEADPALTQPGARITLFVVGTRGDADDWAFEVQGREDIELPAGRVADALLLKREPQRPYDTRVEVWLDPTRAHLPVRARLTTVPGGQPLELSLTQQQPP